MARYHYEARRDAERQYPHHVDLLVLKDGFIPRMIDRCGWCSEHFADWSFDLVDRKRGHATMLLRFYFMDEIAAQQFRERWSRSDEEN